MAGCSNVLSLLSVVLALLHTATPEACGPADVMFVLSANHTIDRAEFDQKIQMIQEYVNSVNIGPGPNDTRVGLISEYDWADLEFHMDDHMERDELLDRLKFVYFGKGQNGVGVGTALEYINMEGMNTHLGGRSGVQDVVIFLTTNNPNASALAKQESTFLQLTGVTQIGAGVGPWDKLDNINVASGCHYVTQTTDTLNSTGAHTYLVESMVNLTCDAVNKVDCCDCCELPKCCPKILDVLYLVDATSSDGQTKLKYQYQIDYLEEMTKALQMDINETKVEAVTYATHPHPQFDLDAYPNKTDLIKALSFLPYQYGGRNITDALRYVDAISFPERMHDNKPVERVVVLTTVGPYGLDMATAIAEADRLKQLGIKVVSIGVDGALKNEYPQLATGSNWLHFPDYTDMVTGVPEGLERLCSNAYDAQGLTPAPNAAQPTNAPSGGNPASSQPSSTQAPVSTTPQPTTPTTTPTTPATTSTTTTTTTTPPTTTAGGLCVYHPCQNGATCVFNAVTSKTTCICAPGWRGENCQIRTS